MDHDLPVDRVIPCSKTNISSYLLFLACICLDTTGSPLLSSVLMLRNDGSFRFLSLGGKETRKREWAGRGQFPSLQQLSYLICHQLILFILLSSGVNTLTSLNTLERLFVEPAKSNQEIVNPSVASVLSYLRLPSLLSV